MSSGRITPRQLAGLRQALRRLEGIQFDSLLLPKDALAEIEPSQVGTIVGTLIDALIPHLGKLDGITQLGLIKHEGILGEREGYPDYRHRTTGLRVELKLIFVDNPEIKMKKPPTRREHSARLTQKVTTKNVMPAIDSMLLIAYRLQQSAIQKKAVTPTVIGFEVFSMIELVEARDKRLLDSGGQWFGNFETPCVLSQLGQEKLKQGIPLDKNTYGRKSSEGKDYNEDTNFGKLQRIPHPDLQAFLTRFSPPRSRASPRT